MPTIKCVMVGNLGVGKTSLFISFTTNKFQSEYVPTVCNTFDMTMMMKETEYTLKVFDTSGHDDYDRLRCLHYPWTDVFIVCFSVVSPSSFYNVSEKWVPEIKFHCPAVPFLLVGTQVDLRYDSNTLEELAKNKYEAISFESGEKLAIELKAVRYMECSSLTQEGLQKVFEEAVQAVLQLPPTKLRRRCVLL